MKPPSILLLDFNAPSPSVETLKQQLSAIAGRSLTVHDEQMSGLDLPAAMNVLATALSRAAADLVIVVFSEESQASASRVLDLILGRKPAPAVVVVHCIG